MQLAKNYIKAADLQGSNFALHFNNTRCYRSVTGGCLSLISIIIIAAILIFKLQDTIALNNSYCQTLVSRSDFSLIDIKDLNLRLIVQVGSLQTRRPITLQQQFGYGVNVTVQINQWVLIDGNPNQTIHEYAMEQNEQHHFIFPQIVQQQNKKKSFNYSLYGRIDFAANDQTKDGDYYRRIGIKVKKCNQSIQGCVPYSQRLLGTVYFLNHKIDQFQKQIQDIVQEDNNYRGYMAPSYLLNDTEIDFSFSFQKVEVNYRTSIFPDFIYSILPLQKPLITRQSWCYDEQTQTTSLYYGDRTSTMFRVRLKRSIYTNTYNKSFKKLDTMFAQVFALVGIIFIAKFILYGGYNQWSFEQKRLKQMDKRASNANIFRYYAQILRRLCNTCLNLVCCRNIEYASNQKYLDYFMLIKRVQFIERKVGILADRQNMKPADGDEDRREQQLMIDQIKNQSQDLKKSLLQKQFHEEQYNRDSLN